MANTSVGPFQAALSETPSNWSRKSCLGMWPDKQARAAILPRVRKPQARTCGRGRVRLCRSADGRRSKGSVRLLTRFLRRPHQSPDQAPASLIPAAGIEVPANAATAPREWLDVRRRHSDIRSRPAFRVMAVRLPPSGWPGSRRLPRRSRGSVDGDSYQALAILPIRGRVEPPSASRPIGRKSLRHSPGFQTAV